MSADFQLGLFSANCTSGLAVTAVPERWKATWEDNLALARIADDAGIDFMLPIARWIGYGGATNFHAGVLDPVTLAAAQLSHTKRLRVFSTIHTAFNHPIVAAKQLATADQIGPGRAGLNVVAGWNKPEYDTMGVELPSDHDSRYALAQEWLDVVQRIWSPESEPFDFAGEHFQLQHVEGLPKPAAGRVPILNAGASPQGRDFAARNADFLFTPVADVDDAAARVVDLRDRAAKAGRSMGVLTLCHVVCRPTREEADAFYRHYAIDGADWEAVDNLMALQGMHAQSFTPEMLAGLRERFAAGHGSYPLIGTPDEIADELAAIAASGMSGTTLSFVDYTGELPYFAQEVIPRLEARGVRAPRPDAAAAGAAA